MVLFFTIANAIPGVDGETSAAMQKVLGTTPWSLAASLAAYMIGDLMNDKVFRKLKEKQGEKGFCLRAIISSLVGELCDSCIFIPLGMNILPKLFLGFEFMTWEQIAIAIPVQALCKTLYESCIVPVTALVAKATKKYEHAVVDSEKSAEA